MLRFFGIISLTFFIISCVHDRHGEDIPVVIFDTDVGNDIDDVLAMQMLFNYEKQNKIKLIGITISKNNPYSVEYVDGFCRLNGFDDMPIGFAYDGPNPEDNRYLRPTLDTLVDGKKILNPQRKIGDDIPEGYQLMRKLLADRKDTSVIIIAVGPETNLSRLLESRPDEYSKLSGVDLVGKKVKFLSVMGGLYDNSFDFPEWNIVQDLQASQKVFENWPTHIIASGFEVGSKLLYPHQSILNDFEENYPLSVSYKVYQEMPYDRQTWDLTSVLYAVEPKENFFNLSSLGKINIDSLGNSLFNKDRNGKHKYLQIEDSMIQPTLQRLVNSVTGKNLRFSND